MYLLDTRRTICIIVPTEYSATSDVLKALPTTRIMIDSVHVLMDSVVSFGAQVIPRESNYAVSLAIAEINRGFDSSDLPETRSTHYPGIAASLVVDKG